MENRNINNNMIFVQGGKFTMGNTYGDGYLGTDLPSYEVEISDFYISKYLVTFDEYDEYCDSNFDVGSAINNLEELYGRRGKEKPYDQGWGRQTRPVINVSWEEALLFCNYLSEKQGLPIAYITDFNSYKYSDDLKETYSKYFYHKPFNEEYVFDITIDEIYQYNSCFGSYLDMEGRITLDTKKVKGYRLATDAEWEYAAKGGHRSQDYKYSGSNNPDEVAVYYEEFGIEKKTKPIKTKLPNEIGLYDMSGNVSEFVQDIYYDYKNRIKYNYPSNPLNNIQHPDAGFIDFSRVCRSGNTLFDIKNSYRSGVNIHDRYDNVGFRICKSI